jgi:hypothetical protein
MVHSASVSPARPDQIPVNLTAKTLSLLARPVQYRWVPLAMADAGRTGPISIQSFFYQRIFY